MSACGVNLSELRAVVEQYINEELIGAKLPEEKPGESSKDFETRKNRPVLLEDKSNKSLFDDYNSKNPKTRYEIWKNFEENGSEPTQGFQRVIQRAILHVTSSGKEYVTGANVLVALFSERESYAVYFLQQQDMSRLDAVSYISHGISRQQTLRTKSRESTKSNRNEPALSLEDTGSLASLLNLQRVSHDANVWDDQVPDDPVLRTPEIAVGIVNFINELLARTPLLADGSTGTPSFTFGIYGPWGSGKSTLLKAVKRQLENENGKIVEINAWHWDEKTEFASFATSSLLNAAKEGVLNRLLVLAIQSVLFVRSHYRKLITFSSIIVAIIFGYPFMRDWITGVDDQNKSAALTISVIGLFSAILAKPLASLIEKFVIRKNDSDGQSQQSIYFSYLRFLTRIGPFSNKPVFFLIDDLDRCPPKKMLSVIETIHSIVGAGNVAIIACDDKLISSAIYLENKSLADNAGEARNFGDRFLEKIVQVHFRMPDLDFADLIQLGLATAAKNESATVASSSGARENGEEYPDDAEPQGIQGVQNPESDAGISKEPEADQLDDIGILRISGEVLGEALKLYRIPVRKLKMLSNLIKLYTGIYRPENAANAYRFITFLVMTYLDPHWLMTHYFSAEKPVEDLDYARIVEFLGESREEVASFYPVLGIGNHYEKGGQRFQKFRPSTSNVLQ